MLKFATTDLNGCSNMFVGVYKDPQTDTYVIIITPSILAIGLYLASPFNYGSCHVSLSQDSLDAFNSVK